MNAYLKLSNLDFTITQNIYNPKQKSWHSHLQYSKEELKLQLIIDNFAFVPKIQNALPRHDLERRMQLIHQKMLAFKLAVDQSNYYIAVPWLEMKGVMISCPSMLLSIQLQSRILHVINASFYFTFWGPGITAKLLAFKPHYPSTTSVVIERQTAITLKMGRHHKILPPE